MRVISTLQARPAAPPPPPPPNPGELREQIRQITEQARAAAQDAADQAQAAAQAAQQGPRPPRPPRGPDFGTLEPGGYDPNNVIPPQAVDIAMGFFVMCAVIVIGWPLARAFGRRLERRGDVAGVNPAMTEQLQRIEQAVDAVAIEVERISESQRFMARLQSASTPERVGDGR